MKLETLEILINGMQKELRIEEEKEKLLSQVFDEGSSIILTNSLYDVIINAVTEEYNIDDTIIDLIWDISCMNNKEFYLDGKKYECSITNLWLLLENKLNDLYSI